MTNSGFIRGMAIGVITGAAIGAAVMPKNRNYKKTTGRFLRTAGEIIENISGLWN